MSASFGAKIKNIRLSRGLTQQEFAQSLGYSDKSMVAHIENGDNEMALDKIALLVSTFGIDANALFESEPLSKAPDGKGKTIYWLNGAYGIGKSTVAERLAKRLGKAYVFDAEEVGNAIRDNYPEEARHSVIFEDYPLWRETNFKLLLDIYRKYDGDIIVPMTLLREASYIDVIKKLEDAGVAVKYVFLDGNRETVHDRILARGESEDCWCMRNIDLCLDSQNKDCHAVHIDATSHSPDETVQLILH